MELEFGSRARVANGSLLSGRRATLNIGFLSALTLGVLLSTNPQHHAANTPALPDLMHTLRTQVEDLTPTPAQPSAYDAEAQMSPAELMARWEPFIADAAKRFDISADWIRAVMRIESGGRTMLSENQRIVSHAGAVGLMQLLPGTYEEMRAQYGLGADAFDPRDNINAGAAYLKWLHRKYGNPGMFAAYNAGPGKFEAHLHRGNELPQETRNYVKHAERILGIAAVQAPVGASEKATFTRPNGSAVAIAASSVRAVRAPLPGEYAPSVRAVLTLAMHRHQGVRQTVAEVRARLNA